MNDNQINSSHISNLSSFILHPSSFILHPSSIIHLLLAALHEERADDCGEDRDEQVADFIGAGFLEDFHVKYNFIVIITFFIRVPQKLRKCQKF